MNYGFMDRYIMVQMIYCQEEKTTTTRFNSKNDSKGAMTIHLTFYIHHRLYTDFYLTLRFCQHPLLHILSLSNINIVNEEKEDHPKL